MQSCFIKSSNGGKDWGARNVVWPYSDHSRNWDCAFAQISDGTLLMHTRVCSFIAPTGIKWEGDQSLGGPPPGMPERLKRQTGYVLFRSRDSGDSWEGPIPVNTAPILTTGTGAHVCGGSGAGHIMGVLVDGGV